MIKALIINFNRLTLPVKIADFLISCNCDIEPIFIDNNSHYPPLLEYYDNCDYEVIKCNQNYGHNVIWKADILNRLKIEDEYIITDPDLDLCDIPKDFLSVLREGLDKYSTYTKCGFGLRINDLPNNEIRKFVIQTESDYWKNPLDQMYFDAKIDTTFSLCRSKDKVFTALRTNEPYCAKHVPWYYTNINDIPDDEIYYLKSMLTRTYYAGKLYEEFIKIK